MPGEKAAELRIAYKPSNEIVDDGSDRIIAAESLIECFLVYAHWFGHLLLPQRGLETQQSPNHDGQRDKRVFSHGSLLLS